MSKEAMKLALEALEQYTDVVASVNDPNSWVTVVDAGKPAREAITALREALAEQPAQQEPVTFLDWYDNAHWGNEDFKAGCWRAWEAALAQRTWVGLNDTDLAMCGSEDEVSLARYWERVCREKNT